VYKAEALLLLRELVSDANIGIPIWLREDLLRYIDQNEHILAIDSLGDYLVEFSIEITRPSLTIMFQIYETFDAEKRNISYLKQNLIRH